MEILQKFFPGFILLLSVFLLLPAFSGNANAQGRKIYVGTGSGFIDYPDAQNTLNLHDDDTVCINPGKYKLMNFKNIAASPGHKIYIINSGLVEFTDPSPSTFSNLTNVEIKGNGTPGIDFGFYIHDVIKGILIDGTFTSVYFSYFKMVNIADYGVFMINPSLVYNGTNDKNSLFYDIKFLHFSVNNIKTTFLQAGLYTRVVDDGLINMTRKLEFAYSTIDNSDQFDVLHLDKVVNASIHHNRFSHLGKIDFRHSAIIYLYGNGDVHHNHISDYWGSGLRAHAISLDAVGAVNVYDNIMTNSRKYSGIEVQSTKEDMVYSSYIHYCNFKIYNNTFGNLSAYDWNCAMVDTYDASGGTIEIKNNLGFNIQRDLPYDPNWNNIYQQLNITKPDTAGNLYNTSYAALGLKEDTSCFLNNNSSAIDKGLTLAIVTDDIDGISRPQGAGYDIGAREYSSGIVYPVANAGGSVSVTLPVNTATLNGTGSYDPNGNTISYNWAQVAGPSAISISGNTTATPFVSNLNVGNYDVQLTVTNALGSVSSDVVHIVVNLPLLSIASAGHDTTIYFPDGYAILNGNASYSQGGSISMYHWQQLSGPTTAIFSNSAAKQTLATNLEPGNYVFQLTVVDNSGQVSKTTVKVQVINAWHYDDKSIKLYPNPCSDLLHVHMVSDSTGAAMIRVTSMAGMVMIQQPFQKNQLIADVPVTINRLPAGLYLLEVIIGNDVQLMDKFIKR